MADIQTVETEASVDDFLNGVESDRRRLDAIALCAIMERVTGVKAKMWGPAIVGFGKCHYQYASGRTGEMPRVAFSPRKTNLTLYMTPKDDEFHDVRLRLGKHKVSEYCLHINRLEDVDGAALEELICRAWQMAKERYDPVE